MQARDFDIRQARTCKCGNTYFRFTTLQNKCVKCLAEKGRKIRIKEKTKEFKLRKEKLKSRTDFQEEAQKSFNVFIRERDKNLPCISCGTFRALQWDAGHYEKTSSHPELRFEELNCHKQCSRCNDHLHGNDKEYRKELINRIGIEKVEWLEGPHEPKKYTVDDLKQIRDKYRVMAKALKWQKSE